MYITLNGIPPSKKNSKRILVNKRTGKRFISSSLRHKEWHDLQMKLMAIHKVERTMFEKCYIMIGFRVSDKIKRDLTNMADSIMDLLVDYGVIKDDNYHVVNSLHLYYYFEPLDHVTINVEPIK
jgi:Holliday junction resolvase RusA-like endonuclease